MPLSQEDREFLALVEEKKDKRNLRKPLRKMLRSLFTKQIRTNLYEVSRGLDREVKTELGVDVEELYAYIQDPEVARKRPKFGILPFHVRWEPILAHGPTSARFAVVDYNQDSASMIPPAVWNPEARRFEDRDGKALDEANCDSLQFHQVNVWAVAQTVLDYFENPVFGMGRPIPWAFEGNRLLLLPHAGYGKNAYYDRDSKSLQFYYFGDDETTFPCLSHDIIAHETGHALLDGIRPFYIDSTSVETAAFHEYIGDLTALLLLLRRNEVRRRIAKEVQGDLRKDDLLAHMAEEFGIAIGQSDALRNAHDQLTLDEFRVRKIRKPHEASRVLTTAMFEILVRMADVYLKGEVDDGPAKERTPAQALSDVASRFASVALRPLDLCPPMDIRFLDYVRAVVHCYEANEPGTSTRLKTFSRLIRDVFHEWGFCRYSEKAHDGPCDLDSGKLPSRLPLHHNMTDVGRSRTAAYYYLNDNRKTLHIPYDQDIEIVDLYGLKKYGGAGHRLPREIVIEYLWREAVELKGEAFGEREGESMDLLCGGTLVLDEYGNILSFFHKPGPTSPGDAGREGEVRRAELLEHIQGQVAAGNR